MSDIKIKVDGDGDGAKRAFDDAGDGAKGFAEQMAHTAEQIHLLYEAAEKAIEKVVEFGKESVEAYFKIEHAENQLKRSAGEATDALVEQAQALSDHTGTSKVTIETMERGPVRRSRLGERCVEPTAPATGSPRSRGTSLFSAATRTCSTWFKI